MKPLRKHLKPIALILALTFLIQSCRVNAYTYKPITVDDAVKSGFAYKTKVKTFSDRTYVFVKVEWENEKIIGLKRQKKGFIKIPVETNQIKEIYNKREDRTLSTILTIGTPVVIVGGLLTFAFYMAYGF